jgi:glycosyltransferase involved in cell wall biosynthesis
MMVKLAVPLWREMGWDLQIISTGETLGSFASQFTETGVPVLHCPERKDLGWAINYCKSLKSITPDVVHEHSEGRSCFKTAIPALMGYKVFRTVHNVFLYTGTLRWQKTLERRMVRAAGVKTITISQSVHDNEAKRLRNPSALCWNWFNDTQFRPPTQGERFQARLELGIHADEFAIVTVGNGNDAKNYCSLIQALPQIRNTTQKIRYFMVGHEHPEGNERLVAKEAAVEDVVIFAGPQQDVRKYLWATDVYVMPSLHEGFGLAAVEALATGITCVFTDCPGLRDFKDFPLEIAWSSPNSDSIAFAVKSILEHPDFGQRNTKNADFVRDYFGVERRARSYADLWNQSIMGRKSSRR